jgi:hypothetical protein
VITDTCSIARKILNTNTHYTEIIQYARMSYGIVVHTSTFVNVYCLALDAAHIHQLRKYVRDKRKP